MNSDKGATESRTVSETGFSGIVMSDLEENEKKRSLELFNDSTSSSETTVHKDSCRKICIIAKLQCVFFPMKLFGLYIQEATSACGQDFSSRRRPYYLKRAYQCFVLALLWGYFLKACAHWIISSRSNVPMLLWNFQTALQGTICFFTMHLTGKKSNLKSLLMYWNTQPNFDELVTEPYMIKCVKRTQLAVYFLMAFNTVLYGLILFLPSESLQPLADSVISPLPDSMASRVIFFFLSLYCSAAWLMPFGIFTAVCLTLIHQCHRLRKTLRLTASANEIRRIKILRQQHSSLCGSVRKVDNLFKFLTLVVYVTNIPLVCFLLFDLIFSRPNGVTTQLTLSFWFVTVALIMIMVSFLGAHLNSKIHSFTEVVQRVQISNVDLDTHTELMLFIAKLNGDPVAITAGGLVPITKPLIVTVTGVVITYFALLYELR